MQSCKWASMYATTKNKRRKKETTTRALEMGIRIRSSMDSGQTGHNQGYFCLPEYHICQFSMGSLKPFCSLLNT